MDATMLRRHHQPAPSLLDGHDAVHGFCPVCGSVAPCYRARRAGVLGPRPTGWTGSRPSGGSAC